MKLIYKTFILEFIACAAAAGLLWHLSSPWWGYLLLLACGTVLNVARLLAGGKSR